MATTIIDALIVTLGLDPSGLKSGTTEAEKSLDDLGDTSDKTQKKVTDNQKKQSDAAAKHAKESELHGKRVAQALGVVRDQVIGMMAAFTAGVGLKDFVKDITTSDAALNRQAKNLNMSSATFAAWQGIAERAGGSAAGMAASMRNLTMSIQEAAFHGTSPVINGYKSIGVALAEMDKMGRLHGRSIVEIYKDVAKNVPKLIELGMFDRAGASYLMQTSLGMDEGTVNVLLKGGKALDKLLATIDKFGVATDESADKSDKLKQAFSDLDLAAEGAGRGIVTQLNPALLNATNLMIGAFQWATEHAGILEHVFVVLSSAATGLGVALSVQLGAKLLALLPGFVAVSAAILATPIGWIIGGITALTIAGYYLMKHWDGIKSWWHRLWGDMSDDVTVAQGKINPGAIVKGSYSSAQNDIASLMRMGWSKEQAAGMVASIQRESSGNASAVGDNGNAYGLFQHQPPRQADFAKWAGHDIRSSSREEQLQFMNYELRQGKYKSAGDKLLQAKDAGYAAYIFSKYAEKPKDEIGEATLRSQIALNLMGHTPDSGLAYGAAANVANTTNNRTSTAHNETHIDSITVQTQATDAQGIAASIGPALEKFSYVPQFNYGLQ